MKPLLYWTIKRDKACPPYAMRVTRATPNRVYGSIAGISTHCHPAACHGKFATEAEVATALAETQGVYQKYTRRIAELSNEVQKLLDSRERAMKNALKVIDGNAS